MNLGFYLGERNQATELWLKTTRITIVWGEPMFCYSFFLSWYLLLKNQFHVSCRPPNFFKFVTNKFHLITSSSPSTQTQPSERERERNRKKQINMDTLEYHRKNFMVSFPSFQLSTLSCLTTKPFTLLHITHTFYTTYECEITLTIINNCSCIIVIIFEIECIYKMKCKAASIYI